MSPIRVIGFTTKRNRDTYLLESISLDVTDCPVCSENYSVIHWASCPFCLIREKFPVQSQREMTDYLDESELLTREKEGIIGEFSPLPEFYEKEINALFGMRCQSCGQVCLSYTGYIPNHNTGVNSIVFSQWRDVCYNRGDLTRELYGNLYAVRAIVHKLSHDLGESGMMANQVDVLKKAADIDPELSEALTANCNSTLAILNKMRSDMSIHQHRSLIYSELATAYLYIDRIRSRKMLEMKLKLNMDQGWVDPGFAILLQDISFMHRTEGNSGLTDDGKIIKNSSDTISRVFEAMSKAACEELNMNWAFIPPPETKCN